MDHGLSLYLLACSCFLLSFFSKLLPRCPTPPLLFCLRMASQLDEDTAWHRALRRMLPLGAPLPDDDHLDYSIAVEYQGPPLPYHLPRVDPLDLASVSFTSPSMLSTLDLASIPIVLPIAPRVSRFGPVRNGVIAGDPRSPLENQRSSSISVPPLEWQDSNFGNESVEETFCSEYSGQGFYSARNTSVTDGKRSNIVNFATPRESEDDEVHALSSPRSTATHATTSTAVDRSGEMGSRKKGICRRCGRGNRLKDREACLVCDARYCSNCLLKAMGSMPEGRKCVGCIGTPINEVKRPLLGKSSRMLSRVYIPLEVKQIMKAEKECAANQLRPEQLIVNGRNLRQDELGDILGSANPPQKLKPGRYWYDKDSGLWGQEGGKPDRIISAKLNVGGKLEADASNGNTKVFINGREITKVELRVLKLASVQCPRDTHLWVYEDGSYEEEGQNNIKGNIWGKASTRILCSLLSLPVPPSTSNGTENDPASFAGRPLLEYMDNGKPHQLLLFGLEGCGTSTLFKQAKFLYGNKFSAEELQNMKLVIQSNLYKYLSILLEGRERFEEEAMIENKHTPFVPGETGSNGSKLCKYSINPRFKHFCDWLLDIMASGDLGAFFPAATREYAPIVDEVWKDVSLQETYKRREELPGLPDVAKYFLDRTIEISSNEYEPSEKDILYAERSTQRNCIAFMDFSFDDRSPMSEIYSDNMERPTPSRKYQLIRINSKGPQDGCKWLEMFEDVRAVMFCASLSDYDQFWCEGAGSPCNKMLASRKLLESLVRHPCFREVPFMLILNKYDSFEEKISEAPLTTCEWFKDFSPLKPHGNNQALAHQAYYYVAVKFKELYFSITGQKLFVCQTRALERATVDEAFKYIREVIRWEEEKEENIYGNVADDSFYSTDMSYTREE